MTYCPSVYYAPSGTTTPPPALVVLTSSLPTAYVGVPYSVTLQAEGGTAPYTWSIATGSLPAWALSCGCKARRHTARSSGTRHTTHADTA